MDNKWITHDLYIAAFCLTNGMKLIDTIRDDRRVNFVFKDTPNRQRLLDGYFNNTVPVYPRSYIASLQALKDIIFQGN